MAATGITRLAAGVRTCLAGAGEVLVPQTCGACGARRPAEGGLCGECSLELLTFVALPYCPRCGHTLGPNIPPREGGCGGCPDPLPRFERVFRLGPYAGCLRRAVRDLKYHRHLAMRKRLTRLLAERVAASLPAGEVFDVVVPIPMHWLRRLARGFDHAGTIASALAARLGVPMGDELVRTRNTPPQAHLPRTRRIENVHGAFRVRSEATVRGASILLVDDVTTTGATANEAARTLLRADANRVALAVLAKAEPPTAYAHAMA